MYEVILQTLQRYQPPNCCGCDQTRIKGVWGHFIFCYQVTYSDAILRRTERYFTERHKAKAFLCRECFSGTLRKWNRQKYLIHLPIIVLFGLIPWFVGSTPAIKVAGLMPAVIYYAIVFWCYPPKRIAADFAWKCIKARAQEAGCPRTMTKEGHVLSLEGWMSEE